MSKNILIVAGYLDLKNNSLANKTILEEVKKALPKVELDILSDLYPDYQIDVAAEQYKLRKADLHEFAQKWHLTMIEVGDIARYVSFQDSPKVTLPSAYGDFELHLFEDEKKREHLLLSKGDLTSDEPLLVRLHSECLTGDVFGSLRCDCGEQLHATMKKIDKVGCGAILYLRQEGSGIGLKNKLKAYQLQEKGFDTYDANLELGFAPDERDYYIAADILPFLNIKQIKLLTNNPDKLEQLEKSGIEIVERLPLQIPAHVENRAYLQTKQEKFHHLLHIV